MIAFFLLHMWSINSINWNVNANFDCLSFFGLGKIVSYLLYFQEDNGANYTKIQKNIPEKEEQQNLNKKTKFDVSGEHIINENNAFVRQLQAARSMNDLLDLAMAPNLSVDNALKLISSITNQINSGKSQIVNIETDQRFIHLRKIVESSDKMKVDMGKMSDDLSQYSQLSTPAMISVSILTY